MSEPRPLVLVPTYNEAENLGALLDAVRAREPTFDVLVIDDASPDGTGAIAQRRADADERVHVLHRPGKEGLGRAYVDGFRWALAAAAGYSHVFEMDADFSHDPKYLRPLLAAATPELGGGDLAIGSRYVAGGGTEGWGPLRRAVSRGGGLYARVLLRLPVHDPTSGFKCFRREVLEALDLGAVMTSGYGFQIELTYRALQAGFRVREVPIVFPDRTRGTSKMTVGIALEAARSVWRLRASVPASRRPGPGRSQGGA